MTDRTYRELRARLDSGEASCSALVEESLDAIHGAKDLNAVLSTFDDRARRQAARVDAALRSGAAGPLAGTTVVVKDNIAVEGEPLTCGSRILEGFRSLYSSTAVERLEAAGAIVVARANMDEFAMGSSNETSTYGPVHHPLDPERVPGGSSGGSGVAVAAGLCHASLGSETGGSVRQPAGFLGLVGVKPTYGRVSRYGLVAFASSLDQIGPFTHTVQDAARVLGAIAGHDPNDATTSTRPVPDYAALCENYDLRGVRVGLPVEYRSDDLHPSVAGAMEETEARLRDAGATLHEVHLPHTRYAIPTYYVISTAEASSNLARFDGARYGRRSPDATTLDEMYEMSRSEGFGAEVKRRIMLGTFVLSSGYYDAYYRKAQQVRAILRREMTEAFGSVDLLLTPTAPTPAFKLGEKTADPIAMYLSDIFTAAANLTGIPALSIPAGNDPESGLPVGIQLMAPAFEEERMFGAAAALERVAV